jgi:hypothetical protein
VGFSFYWWGFILHLNHDAACWAAGSHPEFEQYLNRLSEPWRTIVVAAIAAYKWAIGANTGTDGVDIHFNWFGFPHWIGARGGLQPCS